MTSPLVATSKFLSFVLRHQPEAIGLALDADGWADLTALIEAANHDGRRLDEATIREVVATNDKKRFQLSEDGRRIRAVQGHSIDVDLGLPAVPPPELLYHGTTDAAAPAIRREGLRRMDRHAVHLSPDPETARRVGARRGRPVVLVVEAGRMAADGHEFRVSANGVWLAGAVPPEYLR